jgi:dihydroorotate dehydrogenase
VGTANLINPDATVSVIREMEDFCREKKISRIEELIGTLRID